MSAIRTILVTAAIVFASINAVSAQESDDGGCCKINNYPHLRTACEKLVEYKDELACKSAVNTLEAADDNIGIMQKVEGIDVTTRIYVDLRKQFIEKYRNVWVKSKH
jgi:hypothetical protein